MVKAGVYLVARMTPAARRDAVLDGSDRRRWERSRCSARRTARSFETDLKRILAYTTICALGTMMLLLGVGTRTAIVASLVYLLGHACYKGALFLVAGAVDHETGTRDVRRALRAPARMPVTAAAGLLAAGEHGGRSAAPRVRREGAVLRRRYRARRARRPHAALARRGRRRERDAGRGGALRRRIARSWGPRPTPRTPTRRRRRSGSDR